MENQKLMIRVQDVKKQYRLGQIGGGTLRGDLQSWWARKRGKEDPNTQIGTDQRLVGTTFMALNGVSFTVNKGEAVGIIGSNGAGKSTLLKLLTHVTAPTSGDIDLYGRVASMLEVGTGFHPEMTGRENVYLNGAILGMTPRWTRSSSFPRSETSSTPRSSATPAACTSSWLSVWRRIWTVKL